VPLVDKIAWSSRSPAPPVRSANATALDTDAGELISGLTLADLPGRHRQYTAKDFIRERERMR
jgi:hypothetical protein